MASSYRNIQELADKLATAGRVGKSPRLTPKTAIVLALAARSFATHPTRDEVARALCSTKGGCIEICMTCMGRANVVTRLYQGER